MIEFKGFPARMQYTPIPNVVFSSLLPQITDITELKVLLHVFALVYPKKGTLKFVSFHELLNRNIPEGDIQESSEELLHRTLETLIQKGMLLHLKVKTGGTDEDIFFLNSASNQRIIERVRNGEPVLAGLKLEEPITVKFAEPEDIFTVYEQNIGMLTPLIADELREAGKQYPENWIREAIKEAVTANKRNWRYVARILEHWSTEGKSDGTYRGHSQKNTDPDKYIKGKYGHMVQR